jgi:hypothetical protein
MLLEALAREDATHGPRPRAPGGHEDDASAPVRVVNRVVIHGEPLDFRSIAARAIPRDTRFVVFDLDRTFHLKRNMGELLGWELSAAQSYGDERVAALEEKRGKSPFVFDWSRPLAVVRYMLRNVRTWAVPGLFYLVWGKLAHRSALTRRLRARLFGREPVRAVQAVPQTTLLHQLAGEPLHRVRELARRVWRRHAADQVIDADDIAWLRTHCPGVRIVIASASPQPVLDVAKEELGVDDVIGSVVEEHGGAFAAPFWLDRRFFGAFARPRRLAPPSSLVLNSSHAKILALRARFPEMFAPGARSVGVTDTGYGEDHCWAGHFARLVDVNSDAPFSPLVPATSPLEELHSALPLTRSERDARARGDAIFLDPRRKDLARRPTREFRAPELARILAPRLERAGALTRSHRDQASHLAHALEALRLETARAIARVEQLVALYNGAVDDTREALLGELRGHLATLRDLVDLRTRLERPLAELGEALARELEGARAQLATAHG